jgi:hypothetical protein
MGAVFRQLLAGELDIPRAADRLYELSPSAGGFGASVADLTNEQRARLRELADALLWEMEKRAPGSGLPDVSYGSLAYHWYMASIPRGRLVAMSPPTYRLLQIRVSFWGREIPWLSRLVAAVLTLSRMVASVLTPVLRWRDKDKRRDVFRANDPHD